MATFVFVKLPISDSSIIKSSLLIILLIIEVLVLKDSTNPSWAPRTTLSVIGSVIARSLKPFVSIQKQQFKDSTNNAEKPALILGMILLNFVSLIILFCGIKLEYRKFSKLYLIYFLHVRLYR